MGNYMNPSVTMTQTGTSIAFGMRSSGGYVMLPCSFAGSTAAAATRARHIDVAEKNTQGTLVWSPPT